MATAKKKFQVSDTSGGNKRQIEAERYEFDQQSGRHLFYNGDELVANLINISVEPAA